MFNLLFLILPFAVVVWALFNLRGYYVKERRILFVIFIPIITTYFVLQNVLSATGTYPFIGAKFMHDFSATLLVPLAHIIVSLSLGIRGGVRAFKIMMFFVLLMVPDLMTLLLRPAGSPLLEADAMFNYVQFHFSSAFHPRIQLFAVVVLIQVLVEVQRVEVMRQIFKSRRLFFTRSGKMMMWVCFGGCAWIFLTLLPSQRMVADWRVMMFINAGYSLLASLIFYLIVVVFNDDVIVNSANEPVQFEDDMESNLADSLVFLVEQDKVFLNSSLHIEDVASMLRTNRTYVSRVCRLRFNMTFTELMNHHRIEYSKTLMREAPLKRMEDVAAESGFSTSSFFSRVFKAHEGITPSRWRSKMIRGGDGDA